MADTTPSSQLDELIATTFQSVRPVLADQITNENPLLATLNAKSRVTLGGGTTIDRPVLYAFNDTVGSYNGYDLIDTTPQDGFGVAKYDWKQYAGSVTISGRDERINAGSPRIIALLQAKIEQLRISIEEDLNAMLWADGSGNSAKDLMGVAGIVGDGVTAGSGVLGGIDSDADGQTWWRSQVYTDAIDLTTLDGVRAMGSIRNSRRLAKSKPDVIFAGQDAFEAYEALALPNLRFNDVQRADLGFDTVSFHNAEVMFEDDVPDGKMYFLNTDFLEFVQHEDCWMDMGPFRSPVNQDAKTALVLSMGNLVTSTRRAHAVATDVVTS